MKFKQKEYLVVQSLGSTIAETLQDIEQKGSTRSCFARFHEPRGQQSASL